MIDAERILREMEKKRSASMDEALRYADEVIAGVRARGDEYVEEEVAKWPSPASGRGWPPSTPLRAGSGPGEGLLRAIDVAIERIDSFHRNQKPQSYTWTRNDTTIEHRITPLRRVGIYVPGGRAVYISTLIMCAVPARIAGVEEVIVATPADRPELDYVCDRLGISQIYRAGDAAAIAAMAIGTQTLRRVDKIVGPGNAWVTATKARLFGQVGIDMTAGPTELVLIADDTADPELVAADLMAQAEHGVDSAVICVCTNEKVARAIENEWRPSKDRCPLYVFIGTTDEAIELANRIAPEHLSIQTRNAAELAARAEDCGAIFCGRWSAPAAGDYVIGSNHVLPTAGSARFFSPLGVYDFVKRSNVITAGPVDADALSSAARSIADFEGLPLHGESVRLREAAEVRR